MVRAFAGLSSDVAIDRPTIELFLRNSLRFIVACPLIKGGCGFSELVVDVCDHTLGADTLASASSISRLKL